MPLKLLILTLILCGCAFGYLLFGNNPLSHTHIDDTSRQLVAVNVARDLSPGWNLGNQLDAVYNCVADEKIWRGHCTSQAFFDSVAAAGIKSVRIPVTWLGHIGPGPDFIIDSVWLNRVKEVVGYAKKAGLNTIINIHHDGGRNQECRWLDLGKAVSSNDGNSEIEDQLAAVWTQIANAFIDFDQSLIFEPFNEICYPKDATHVYNDERAYEVINGWNQVFVDAVRATGGNNKDRLLAVVGYGPTVDRIVNYLKMPKDIVVDRLIVSVHSYTPYYFTLNPIDNQWGHTRSTNLKDKTYSESYVKSLLDKLKHKFVDNGIPVYFGELGCVHRDDSIGERYRKYYLEYVCKAATDRGIACFIWDNGKPVPGYECHGYFRHDTGQYMFNGKEMVATIVNAITDNSPEYTLESVYNKAP